MASVDAQGTPGSAHPAAGPSRPDPGPDPVTEPNTAGTPGGLEEAGSVRDQVLENASRRQAEEEARDRRPRATRVSDGAILGGVSTGLARHLGWPVLVIR